MPLFLKTNHPVYGDIKGNFYGTCRRLDDPPQNENFCKGLVGRRATKIQEGGDQKKKTVFDMGPYIVTASMEVRPDQKILPNYWVKALKTKYSKH